MTAINCSAEQSAPRFLDPNGIGPDRRNGLGVPGHVYLPPLRLLSLRHLSHASVLSLFFLDPPGLRLGCHKPGIPDGGSGSRNRACKTPVKVVLSKPGINGKTMARQVLKCLTNVPRVSRGLSGRGPTSRIFLFRLCETSCSSISVVIVLYRSSGMPAECGWK